MIIDNIKNIGFYNTLVPKIEETYRQVAEMAEGKEDGRYQFEGGFFLIQTGKTKPMEEGFFEAHRKYIDIQILVEGSEEIAWALLENLTEEVEYNTDKDVLHLSGDTNQNMKMEKDMFYVAFPHDGHRPIRHLSEQQAFKKIVLKLPV